MKTKSIFTRALLCAAATSTLVPPQGLAAPLALSTAPAGTGYRPPAPNVLISVDNSNSMMETGMEALRNALSAVASETITPDGSIRLGWQTMNPSSGVDTTMAANNDLDGVKVLDAARRTEFQTWTNALKMRGNTPSHRMMRIGGEYFRKPLDIHSAWASVPGKALEPLLDCRRAYHLFMTEGGWNQVHLPEDDSFGDVDHTTAPLPDGTTYKPGTPATLPYGGEHSGVLHVQDSVFRGNVLSGGSGSTVVNTTLSDLAFYYWATDLQPELDNNLTPKIETPGQAAVTSGSITRTIPEYWNPKNDPATWQHLTTYTIGFNAAANWSGKPIFGTDTWTGGDYDALLAGTTNWPDPIDAPSDTLRTSELWHMALNSRGKFIPAPDANGLADAFKEVITQIVADQSAPTTSLSTSSRSTRTDSVLYASGYDGSDWSGGITAQRITTGTAAVDTAGVWGDLPASAATAKKPAKPRRPKSTGSIMDANGGTWPASRLVLSSKTASPGGATTGISWEWDNLHDDQKSAFKTVGGVLDPSSDADATAQDRMAYLRGDRTREQSSTPAGPFRNRGSRHGDIVNSKLWYLDAKPASGYTTENYAKFRKSLGSGRASMLYVGANDGMLHGFDAATGQEKIAYVPEGLHSKLVELTRPTYTHAYYVDGSPFTGDLYLGEPGSKDETKWKTYLAGFLGAGGRGYFVLDVTDPSSFSPGNAANLVVMDKTGTNALDADVGHIFSEPVMEGDNPAITRQIVRMNNGRWTLITGNGYNSASEKAVLLIQYLDGDKELVKIVADSSAGNGLSAPRLIDFNGDNIPDVAYAGDLLGNMWKFDLSADKSDDWEVAFSGSPLFTATDGTTLAKQQPITSAPVWVAHPDGGLVLVFGTGRNLTVADRSNSDEQTIYGIYDNTSIERFTTPNKATGSGTVELKKTAGYNVIGRDQLVQQTVISETTLSSNPVPYTGSPPRKGWFIDLPVSKERVLQNLNWFDGDLIDVWSTVPAQGGDIEVETCNPPSAAGRTYRTTIDTINGSAPKSQIYGTHPATDSGHVSRVGLAVSASIRSSTKEFSVTPGGSPLQEERDLLSKSIKRASWRQLQ